MITDDEIITALLESNRVLVREVLRCRVELAMYRDHVDAEKRLLTQGPEVQYKSEQVERFDSTT